MKPLRSDHEPLASDFLQNSTLVQLLLVVSPT
jgi:hypothetical protein